LASEEWRKLQEALRKAPTEEARKAAAEAMRRYLATQPAKRSRPTLVSLGLKKTYPHAVPVDKIPDELAKNPEFYELLSRIIAKK